MICNPTHILGPGDTHNWARLIMLVDQRKLPGVPPGSGAFVDVREAAAAHIAAAERGRCGENYLLGGEETSFLDLVQRVGRLLGKPTPGRALPAGLMKAYAQALDWRTSTRNAGLPGARRIGRRAQAAHSRDGVITTTQVSQWRRSR